MTPFVLADTVRVATFNVSLGRRGPGVLLKGILSGKDEQVAAVVAIIQRVNPDIMLLNEFDNDYTNLALTAFQELLDYPYAYAPLGNEGRPSGLDMDGDGKPYEWADALGFGRFPGSEGMALLSRYPIGDARSFANLRLVDLENAVMPKNTDGSAFLTEQIMAIQRMSSKSHWDVAVVLPNGKALHILASHPSPPVFDGPEDVNGLRNSAEVGFWVSYLDGQSFEDDEGQVAPFYGGDFVLLGDLNSDPADGEGHKPPLLELLTHPLVQDTEPQSKGAVLAVFRLGGANEQHLGNPALDTVEWDADIGNMRVDYALPSASLTVHGSGVFWPASDTPFGHMIAMGREGASNHRLVWVDVALD
ncbi:MAG: endonuclease/exonuclease/phosphatase family protein [Alphaproteobacteria bacterium]